MESIVSSLTNISSVGPTPITTTTNSNNSATSLNDNITPIFVVSVLVCATVFVIGTLGNFLVLIIFGRRCHKLKKCEPHYIYLVSLALCDLLGSVIIPVDKLYYLFGGDYSRIGVSGCISLSFITITTFTVSSLTLMAISLHRFILIKWPLRVCITRKATMFTLACIWSIGCLPGIPYLMKGNVVLHTIQGTTRKVCNHDMPHTTHFIHTLLTFSVQVAIPLVVISTTYCLIIYQLIKVQRSDLFATQGEESQKRHKRNRKTIKLLIVVAGMFFACVTPANIFYLCYLFEAVTMSPRATFVTFNILVMIQMSNNCLNPIIYSKLHTTFRRKVLRTLCFCCSLRFLKRNFAVHKRPTYSSAMSSEVSRRSGRVFKMHRYSQVGCVDTEMGVQALSATMIDPDMFSFNRAKSYRAPVNV